MALNTQRSNGALPEADVLESAQRQIGRVSLIGAGPGDPDLLTLKAYKRLLSAQVVLYDRLVSDEILAL